MPSPQTGAKALISRRGTTLFIRCTATTGNYHSRPHWPLTRVDDFG